ncbi:MAG: hypothetical protein AAGE52_38515 [Myxococcota bacterium]
MRWLLSLGFLGATLVAGSAEAVAPPQGPRVSIANLFEASWSEGAAVQRQIESALRARRSERRQCFRNQGRVHRTGATYVDTFVRATASEPILVGIRRHEGATAADLACVRAELRSLQVQNAPVGVVTLQVRFGLRH